MRFTTLSLAAGLLALPGVAEAQTAYAIDFLATLYRVNFATGDVAPVGPTGMAGTPQALALAPGGALYGTDADGRLYRLDAGSGAATLVGNTGRGNVEGLDFLGATLYGLSGTSPATLFTVDPTTAATATALTTTFTSPVAGDVPRTLAFADATTAYFTTSAELNRLDLATGVSTVVGSTGLAAAVTAIDFLSDGNLYGLTATGRGVRLNTTTGAASILFVPPTSPFWLGMTAAPAVTAAPEPSTLALTACGVLAVVGAARRRRRPRG